MIKQAAFLTLALSALLAGCDTPDANVSEAETSAPPPAEVTQTASAPAAPAPAAAQTQDQIPAPVPATPIIGCWIKNTPGVAVTISINADQTCSELVVADPGISAGRAVLSTCTWAARDSSALNFSYTAAGAELCTYIIVGDAMTMLCPYMSEPQTYQRTACQ